MLESMLSSSNDDLIVTAINDASRYSLLKASARELSPLKSKITLNQGGSMKQIAKVS
jgi:hypothetical protein